MRSWDIEPMWKKKLKKHKIEVIFVGVLALIVLILAILYLRTSAKNSGANNLSPTPVLSPTPEPTEDPNPTPTLLPPPPKKPTSTPKPTTIPPTATPSAAVSFQVTDVQVKTDQPNNKINSTSGKFTFTGTITTNASGTVGYKWEGDGVNTSDLSVNFSGAGSQSVQVDKDYSVASSSAQLNGKMKLKILSPNQRDTEISFCVNCP